MMTAEECLRRARLAERAADQLEVPEFQERILTLARAWRRRAAALGARRPIDAAYGSLSERCGAGDGPPPS